MLSLGTLALCGKGQIFGYETALNPKTLNPKLSTLNPTNPTTLNPYLLGAQSLAPVLRCYGFLGLKIRAMSSKP